MSKPDYWDQACIDLKKVDPIMSQLIGDHPESHMVSHGNALMTLARSIVGQQISVKAAASIWARVECCLGEIDAEIILQKPIEALRGCGLSERKVLYLKDLARFSQTEGLLPENWEGKDDETIIRELISIKGIGRWTAEMFLMFCLQRPDVYPLDDVGLQKAVSLYYCNHIRPTPARLRQIGEIWQPWRTVASWYLWNSLDPLPVSY